MAWNCNKLILIIQFKFVIHIYIQYSQLWIFYNSKVYFFLVYTQIFAWFSFTNFSLTYMCVSGILQFQIN